ncbi:MAG: hypothetical protein HZB46_11160 [Solirubrobacterales bacterium]|nr:hypothetical protein [Solirubrobacterales bacterium]
MRRLLLAVLVLLAAVPGAAAQEPDLVEGQAFTRALAAFDKPTSQVRIDWGDGSPLQDAASVDRADGKREVTATHTYAKFGFYAVKVTDRDDASRSQTAYLTVKDAPITAEGTTFPVGDAAGGVLLATITDANPLGRPDELTADVDWGDGTTSAGMITAVPGAPGRYEVRGAHAYPDAATYLAGISIRSVPGGGDASADAQATASVVVDDAGTAHVVFASLAPGRTGDAVTYCQIPRGARGCSVRRRYLVDALTPPVILRDRDGRLHIVVSYNGTRQLGGGTLIMSSADAGATWSYNFTRVNTGIFQGAVNDAALSRDGRVAWILFGFGFGASDKAGILAGIGLDRPTLFREDAPGKTQPLTGDPAVDRPRIPYAAKSVATLADGQVLIAGYDDDAAGRSVPRAALRVVAGADNAAVARPWVPIRAGFVRKLAAGPSGAGILTTRDCVDGVELSPLRGTRPGTARPLLRERFMACNARGGDDLFYDAGGGRHVVMLSDEDGCQGPSPHDRRDVCLLYRRARPGGDFGPKTTLYRAQLLSDLHVATARDGVGVVVWREQLEDGSTRIRLTATDTSSEQELGRHRLALTLRPSAECAKRFDVDARVTAVGPSDGRPRITRVTWSNTRGALPRRRVDGSGPFTQNVRFDRRELRNLSSTGTIVFSTTLRASVRYRAGGRTRTARLEQVVSWFCGVDFDRVERGRL